MTITWEEMIALEPGLSQLLVTISKAKLDEDECKDDLWYGPGGFKEKLLALVGRHAYSAPDALTNTEAYDIAYEKLYGSLPKCECCRQAA